MDRVGAVQAAALELRRDSSATHHYHHRPSLRPLFPAYPTVKSAAALLDQGHDSGSGGDGQGQEFEGQPGCNNKLLSIASTHAERNSVSVADDATTATAAVANTATTPRTPPGRNTSPATAAAIGSSGGLAGAGPVSSSSSSTSTSGAKAMATVGEASNVAEGKVAQVQDTDKEEVIYHSHSRPGTEPSLNYP